jgi:RNA polymerase sigma factor (sigma-70 family)
MLTDDQVDELLALDAALQRLADFNPRGAQVVQYRYFGGLSLADVGRLTGMSERTIRRAWTAARAWLRREVELEAGGRAPRRTLSRQAIR